MTSTPRKLRLVTRKKKRVTNPGSTTLGSFDELGVALATDTRFESYRYELPQDDVFSLNNGDSTLIFAAASVWGQERAILPFLSSATDENITLVCVGTESDFSSLPKALEQPYVHLLLTPTTLTTCHFQVQGLFRSKSFHDRVHRQAQETDEKSRNIKYVLEISRELNGFRDVNRLLNLILKKAREVTHADAGSIYVVERPERDKPGSIVFKITQNESVNLNLSEFRMPISDQSIVGNSVLHAKSINIPDLYTLDEDPAKNPYNARHDTSWDQRNNYMCRSMLSVPIFDISHEVIGVIQLINRKIGDEKLLSPEAFESRVIPFSETDVEYAEIVSHQAGIALENAVLTEQKEALFEGFVSASVKAIEQRDPTTSGHSDRVAKLTLNLAELVNRTPNGAYGSLRFNDNQMKEIEYASLLHDFGKLGVREQVLLKAKKLYPWQLELLHERFEVIRAQMEIGYYRDLVNYMKSPHVFPPGVTQEQFEREYKQRVAELEGYMDFILKANEPTVLEQGGFERLKDIANITFSDSKKKHRAFLKGEELKALSVSRGSLTSEEFSEIQSHVTHTYEFLRKIPWGSDLSNVPHIAAKHHEKLDGSGYPTSAAAEEIPVQSRMMTIADIFDALTAADRPYKRAVPIDRALDIIEMEVKAGKCDSELFKIFVEAKAYSVVTNSHP